ncbi:MAG: hypothetical protein E7299_05195 [Lachnospiraceae bacterium]|nr:hypothetical protein [Lachnospiraceae bacterium]
MIDCIKEICFLTMLGKLILSTQSGKQYEKICKVMLELITVIYLMGALLGFIKTEDFSFKVLGEQIETEETKLLEIEKNINDMQENMCLKIKSKINNGDFANEEFTSGKLANEEFTDEEGKEKIETGMEEEVISFVEIEKVQIDPIKMEGEHALYGQKQQNDYCSQ